MPSPHPAVTYGAYYYKFDKLSDERSIYFLVCFIAQVTTNALVRRIRFFYGKNHHCAQNAHRFLA